MMEVEIVNKGRGLSPGLSGPLQRDIDHRYHAYTMTDHEWQVNPNVA